MKQLQPDPSDNLYYMDSLGDIPAQLEWLDSLQIIEAALFTNADHVQSVVLVCLPPLSEAVFVDDRSIIHSVFYQIYPSKDRKAFGGKYVVDIYRYLTSYLSKSSTITYFKLFLTPKQ